MKIIIAPDSFKGTMTAARAADAMEAGVRRVYKNAEVIKMPIADGGEGTVQTVHRIMGGQLMSASVLDPKGYTVDAEYCILDNGTAVMEMAQASGLILVPEEDRDVLHSSTYGTGQMIKDALDRGCKKIIIGIGGSATNDGGTGMAQALGVCLMGDKWRLLSGCGANLALIKTIDATMLDKRLKDTGITVLCDVENPLCGENGATRVYSAQKGADPQQTELMEYGMSIYAELLKRDVGADVAFVPGAGAAGGLGAGLMAFCGAKLAPGAKTLLELYGFEEKLAGADLVITGEGKTDSSSLFGKAPAAVAAAAKKAGVKAALVSGLIDYGACQLSPMGFSAASSLTYGEVTAEMAMKRPEIYAAEATERLLLELQKHM